MNVWNLPALAVGEVQESIYKYFGHLTLRLHQPEMFAAAHSVLFRNEYDGLIMAADPGIGKSPVMTALALLAREKGIVDKVIFIVPTGTGSINLMTELASVSHPYKVVHIESKNSLCQWIQDKEDPRILAITEENEKCGFELCKIAKKLCPYKNGGCPYYEQKNEAQSADILVCDYNYVFSPFIRRNYGIDEFIANKKVALFVDECHKLPERMFNTFSKQTSSRTIGFAIKELEEYNYNKYIPPVEELRDALGSEIELHFEEMSGLIKDKKLSATMKRLNPRIYTPDKKMVDKLINIGAQIKEEKFNNNKGVVSYTEMVAGFMKAYMVSKEYEYKYIFFTKLKNDFKTMYIGWEPYFIGDLVTYGISGFTKIIFYSGTVDPYVYKKVVGLDTKEWKNRIYVSDLFESPYLKNRKDIIYTKRVFYSENRSNEKFLRPVKKEILKIIDALPKPVVVIATQNWFECLELDLPFLLPPDNMQDAESWVKVVAPGHDLIYISPHCRIAQSVDMGYIKSVLFLGIPYKQINEITEERKRRLGKSLKGKASNNMFAAGYMQYVIPAFEAVIQSVMRGLRSENDSLVVVYSDARFKTNKRLLRNKPFEICDEPDELMAAISRATEQNKNKDKDKV